MGKRVFISKSDTETTELKELLSRKGYSLISQSFLRFEPVEFHIENKIDVLFFGSPRAVVFFKAQYDLSIAQEIACTGNATAHLLLELGTEPSFVGEKSSDVEATASAFRDWLGDRHVHFPLSDRSLRSFPKVIPPEQQTSFIAYKTTLEPRSIPRCDVYVFTSPSNVEGFLLENTLPASAKVISWGSSTSKSMLSRGIATDHELKNSDMMEIIAFL